MSESGSVPAASTRTFRPRSFAARRKYADASTLYTSLPYVAADMVWWRLRPVANGVIAEYSADTVTWQLLGIRTMTVPTTVTVEVIAGVGDNSTFSGTGRFERLIVCN